MLFDASKDQVGNSDIASQIFLSDFEDIGDIIVLFNLLEVVSVVFFHFLHKDNST